MRLTALVHSVEKDSFFTVIHKGRKVYFYLQKNLIKKFYKYLQTSTYVSFDYDLASIKKDGVRCYKVNHFISISNSKYSFKSIVHYDLDVIRGGIKDLVNNMNPIMFVDFEMNMQDYQPINNFVQEIIETGVVITNQDGAILKIKHWYIKPTKFQKLTKRTIKFLHYTKAEIDMAITFKEFYNEFKMLCEKYNPYVVVWGKSDITSLKKTCQINNVPELNLRFVNLLQLHTNYDNLKNSPGLFSMWEAYNNTKLPEQRHDSLEDAMVTKDVFFKFKEKVNG